MMRAARRYAPHLVVISALALLPVLVHEYSSYDVDDCVNPFALAPSSVVIDGDPIRQARLRDRFEPHQWQEGTIRSPEGPMLRYAIVRSFDPKRVYYRPELALVTVRSPRRRDVDWLDVDGDRVPIHRAHYSTTHLRRTTAIAAYLLVYEGRAVEDPYRAQLLAAPRQIFTGARPMTLFFVWGLAVSGEEKALTRARADEWLSDAWRSYTASCQTVSQSPVSSSQLR